MTERWLFAVKAKGMMSRMFLPRVAPRRTGRGLSKEFSERRSARSGWHANVGKDILATHTCVV